MPTAASTSFSRILGRFVAAIGVACTVALLAFVHPPTVSAPGRTIVTLWYVSGAEEAKPQAPGWFNESQDATHVKAIGLPFMQIEQKLLTAVAGNVAPDIFAYFGAVAQWSSRGALAPLDDYMERDGFDRSTIFPALWPEMTWDGKTYAIPVGAACDAFYWNKEHFRLAGLDPERPPRTWAELEEYAERLTVRDADGDIERAGYIPGYWSPVNISLFMFWALQKGASYLSEDGRTVDMTSDACVEALEWEAALHAKLGGEELIELTASFGYGAQHGFLSGRLSMVAQKSSFVQELGKFAPDLEYGCAMFPLPEGGRPATTLGPLWIAIPAGADRPDEAWEYIRFLASTEVQTRQAAHAIDRKRAGFFPSNMLAAQSPKQMSVPYMQVFLDSMQWARSPSAVPLAHGIFWREYGQAWEKSIRGVAEPRDALRAAQVEVQRALDAQLEYDAFHRLRLKKAERK